MERRVALAGSSGLIGTAVSRALTRRGDTVVPLVRDDSARGIPWDPARGEAPDLAGFDAVIVLNGSPIAGRRWTGAVKQDLRDSRIEPVAALAEAAARAGVPVFLSASAIGVYGDAGEIECVDGPNGTPPGSGFLASLCVEWEAAADPARAAGVRVAHLRFGHVLSAAGGLVPVLRRIYRLGLGGRLGSGHQWMSWISRDDAARAVLHVLDGAVTGPVNIVAPAPVRQQAFSEALGRAVSRPARWVVPRFALRAAVGEVADESLLTSQRAVPRVLHDSGFRFAHTTLPAALAAALADEA
ncbi:TIGR01777 family oxidoreductase [Tsukamurella paurometabola]|uniref:Epimerase family protein SA0724 n=1 Tax=Tsukamurella paurometabola TaxID=2061 RepID=A0A3P8K439_TSUPA|nr:TIGR01777 family oxidoreductase [Tsukamurella paurometabola]MBS4103502.1 TIGR01777 family oxidoreductase [Tsukamurella paurometabola]UEA83025.1 TIGR01777 family oxidoreductase [Tsukamurella paurometabola]VDR40109.1 Epimerase family protein SA0724 [Tsukamurella paurometabola]